MNIFFLIPGILFIIASVICFYKRKRINAFYKKIKNGTAKDYVKTVGVVICDAYHISDATELNKPVTPIVEYVVNNEKYEAQNRVLESGAELPVGTEVYVWYRKDNPKIAVLSTELKKDRTFLYLGAFLLLFGLMFLVQYL